MPLEICEPFPYIRFIFGGRQGEIWQPTIDKVQGINASFGEKNATENFQSTCFNSRKQDT